LKKPIFVFLIFLFLSLIILINSSFTIKPVLGAEQDLIVRSGETRWLNNTIITMSANVIVEEDGILILNNATINMWLMKTNQYNITVYDGGQLKVLSSSGIKIYPSTSRLFFNINFEGESSGSLRNLIVTYGRLILGDSSSVAVDNLQMDRGQIITRGSSALTISNSQIKPPALKASLTLQESSTVSLSRTTATDLTLYNSSRLFVSDCQYPATLIGAIRTYDTSKVVVRNSTNGWRLETHGTSSATILGLQMKSAEAFDSSMISIFGTTLTTLKASDSAVAIVNRATATSLSAYGASRLNVINSTVIFTSVNPTGGGVEAYGSSNVWLSGSIVRAVGAYDSSRVSLVDSTVEWITRSSSLSVLSITKSKVTLLSANDFSSVVVSKSEISLLDADKFCSVNAINSTIREVAMYFKYVNASFEGLKPTLYTQWGSLVNGFVVLNPGGYAPNVTLTRTKITEGWDLWFFGASNAIIVDSAVRSLGAYNSAVVQLVNSSTLSYDIKSEARVSVSWYLDVFALNGTNVTVFYNGTAIAPTITVDSNGLARFTLLERALNTSRTLVMGSYTVNAVGDGGSEQRSVEITGYKTIDLTPPPPWWQQLASLLMGYWYLILGLAVAVFLAILMFLRLRKRRLPSLSR